MVPRARRAHDPLRRSDGRRASSTAAEFIARYEAALGRAVVDLEWHEIFALIRSTAINDRQARLAATSGVPYPGVAGETNPVLPHLAEKIDAFEN